MVQPQDAGAGEHDQQIGDIVGDQACQHGGHGDFRRDAPPNEAADDQHRAADAAARQNLIGEQLCDAKRNQGPNRSFVSGMAQGLVPDQGGADIGDGLNQDRQKKPSRTRRSRQLDDPFERAEVQDDEDEGKNAEETGHP